MVRTKSNIQENKYEHIFLFVAKKENGDRPSSSLLNPPQVHAHVKCHMFDEVEVFTGRARRRGGEETFISVGVTNISALHFSEAVRSKHCIIPTHMYCSAVCSHCATFAFIVF